MELVVHNSNCAQIVVETRPHPMVGLQYIGCEGYLRQCPKYTLSLSMVLYLGCLPHQLLSLQCIQWCGSAWISCGNRIACSNASKSAARLNFGVECEVHHSAYRDLLIFGAFALMCSMRVANAWCGRRQNRCVICKARRTALCISAWLRNASSTKDVSANQADKSSVACSAMAHIPIWPYCNVKPLSHIPIVYIVHWGLACTITKSLRGIFVVHLFRSWSWALKGPHKFVNVAYIVIVWTYASIEKSSLLL